MKKLITLIGLTSAAIWIMVAQNSSAPTDMQASAIFKPDVSQPTKTRGKVTMDRGIGGFGRLTYVGKGFTVVRPVYPKGHQLNSAEWAEEQNFQWPSNMTPADFDDMQQQRRQLEGE